MSGDFYQIYYQEDQKSKLFPFAKPYFNPHLTIFFENSIIKHLVASAKGKYVSVCSWKLCEKLRWRVGSRAPLTEEAIDGDYEVLSFTKNTKYHYMLASADRHHPGFKDSLKKILAEIGHDMPMEVKEPIYQNHFSARTDIYRDYVLNYLNPAIYVMEHNPELHALAMKNSGYTSLTNQTADHLKNKLGISYYPMAPFLLERLFSVYVHNNKIKVTHL